MTDVLMTDTVDGGDIEVTEGRVTMDAGIRTAMYLSLFGGNEEDSGLDSDDPAQWWGNFTEPDEIAHARSETQHLLRSAVITSAFVRTLELAAERDLEWLISEGLARRIETTVTLPARNRVSLEVDVISDSGVERAEYLIQTEAR